MSKIVDKRFTFMESYLRSINMITNKNLKLDFLLKVLNYGLYQDEPKFDNDFAKGHFEEIKSHIDLSNYQREKNRINGSKGGAPVGNSNAKKQPKTTETSKNNLIEIKRIEKNRIESKTNKKEELYGRLPGELRKAMEDFEKMRIQIKKPLTDRARETILLKLQEYSKGNLDIQIEILNRSIVGCWSSVYPLEKQSKPIVNSKGLSVKEILSLKGGN